MAHIKYIRLSLILIFITLSTVDGFAQPTPGKEKVSISLPTENRWKSKRIKKDTPSIRSWEHTVRGRNRHQAPVQSVLITTIDRRYYPIKAQEAINDKLQYTKARCPEAKTDIIHMIYEENRATAILAIRSDTPDECGTVVRLSLIAEGPTALHTIDLEIPITVYTDELLKSWSEILKNHVIE